MRWMNNNQPQCCNQRLDVLQSKMPLTTQKLIYRRLRDGGAVIFCKFPKLITRNLTITQFF